MKLTGERPIEGSTPDSLVALHEAGYREVARRLGPGTVLDIGCGVGDGTERLFADDRFVLGIDYDAPTAIGAQQRFGTAGRVAFAAMDGSRLGLRSGSIDWVVSSHVVEHFTQPERHVAELARLVAPGGTVFVLTPNRPADFENPFHVYEFEPPQLDSLLRLFFEEVTVLGLDGDATFAADFARRRASGERILKLDRFRLRQKLPHRTYVWAYERVLPMVYRVLGNDRAGIGSGIDDSHLFMNERVTTTTPVLFAVARGPRARVS